MIPSNVRRVVDDNMSEPERYALRALFVGTMARRLRARYELDRDVAITVAQMFYVASERLDQALQMLGLDPGDAVEIFATTADVVRQLTDGDPPNPTDN